MSNLSVYAVQGALKPRWPIRNVIAVGSGKGGVGKSTTALQLALSLQSRGLQVGFLDADIQGPSLAKLVGTENQHLTPPAPTPNQPLQLEPVEAFGLKTLSFAYLLPKADQPVIWRGPMMSSALTQLFFQGNWGELDVLVIDLPPGTGDILLTLGQKIPVTAAVLVTTPQEVALLDVLKAYRMFEKFGIFVAGLINNMAFYRCPACGHQEALFGEGAPERMADALEIPLLGALPLVKAIAEGSDQGKPVTLALPDIAALYSSITDALLARLQTRAVSYAHRFPDIVVK